MGHAATIEADAWEGRGPTPIGVPLAQIWATLMGVVYAGGDRGGSERAEAIGAGANRGDQHR